MLYQTGGSGEAGKKQEVMGATAKRVWGVLSKPLPYTPKRRLAVAPSIGRWRPVAANGLSKLKAL